MAKGRTKNKRARKPDTVYKASQWPPPRPTAYFTTGDGRFGYAEASLNGFYNPLEPVYKYIAFVHPGPALSLDWRSDLGWSATPSNENESIITRAIENTFTPMWYRFEPIQI